MSSFVIIIIVALRALHHDRAADYNRIINNNPKLSAFINDQSSGTSLHDSLAGILNDTDNTEVASDESAHHPADIKLKTNYLKDISNSLPNTKERFTSLRSSILHPSTDTRRR